MNKFQSIQNDLTGSINAWEPKLLALPDETITHRKNKQNRSIKQILGHMIDSASNNTHRVIHLQYQASPVTFPDYANHGNNEKWIAIQNYQAADWHVIVMLWKYIHLHFLHVIHHADITKLHATWISGLAEEITLEQMILDFPRHFNLHISEIQNLIDLKNGT